MIIYNVTTNVDDSIHDQWIMWMQNKHIDNVLATGCFFKAKMVKVLIEEEMGGTTYSTQYYAESKAKIEEYYQNYAPQLRDEGYHLFGDKVLAFRTELEVLKEFYRVEN